ncbi:MAG TPA: hypothetical protein VKF80_00785 [Candidatus Eisenbacteria bacterium]|nr:hypothetical protein [Candidatus Eisenbacteria bacterium]
MREYSAAHFSDPALVGEARQLARGERSNLVQLLVCIAEIDFRKLYLPAGYPSLSAFCAEEYRLTEDEAEKRIHAARTARVFPVLFKGMDERRLCMTAVSMLARHLTNENVDELMEAAVTCRRISDLRAYLQQFAKPDLLLSAPPVPVRVVELPAPGMASAPPGEAGAQASVRPGEVVESPAPERVSTPPVENEWVELRIKVRKSKLQQARNLLSHAVPSGNASTVFDRALDALIAQSEKRKHAACTKPRAPRLRATQDRCIPAHIRRVVWERDAGQCTFVSDDGRRCAARRLLEFDHVKPVARGGKASVEGVRLRCRGHNQYEAERTFGADFMQKKREEAKASRRRRAGLEVGSALGINSTGLAVADAPLAGQLLRDDVIAGLRALGVGAKEAPFIVERSGALEEATLEESMRAALRCLGPRRRPSG